VGRCSEGTAGLAASGRNHLEAALGQARLAAPHDRDGFSSTASLASAPYRAAVLSRLDDPGVQNAVRNLMDAERQIRRALGIRGHKTPVPGGRAPGSGMAAGKTGKKIRVSPNVHGWLSRELLRAAAAQRRTLESARLLSNAVYAGGDDLLAFAPAANAPAV
jgi:hypothetical protein